MTNTHNPPDLRPKRCKGCGHTKTVISFTEHTRDGRTIIHDVCNACRACAGLPLHSGWTANETYLKYNIPIRGMPPQSSRYNRTKVG